MKAAQLTPVSALKDFVPMQDICYYLHFDLEKSIFLLAFLEGGCFISRVYQGH